MLSLQTQQTVEKLLVQKNFLTQQQLEEFKLQAVQNDEPLLSAIQKADTLKGEDLTQLLAQANSLPYVNLTALLVPPDVLTLLPRDTAERYKAVVFGRVGGRPAVGMVDPGNVQAIDFLTRKIGEPVVAYMASEVGIENVMMQYPADMSSDIKQAAQNIKEDRIQTGKSAKSMQDLVQDAPISRALSTILEYAANLRASDIHIEPQEKDLRIRFRIDGVLREAMVLPKDLEPALVSRIKILSNLKIDEHRIPQDGSFVMHIGKKDIDLRIAIAPVTNGEQIVIRLLDKDNTMLTLEALGFKGRAFRLIQTGIHSPHGMTLATGPTGSGKSTTLYAILQAIKSVTINVVTLEDPVEYKMDGVNQIQINTDVGLTFASGLRSILRQDPNVIMVGEMRDHETANLAVQAALTGHVVLSTIHTNSAAGVLPRLTDMDVEPFLVASTVNTVIGQRLVRRVCPKCKEPYQSSPTETESIKDSLGSLLPKTKEEAVKAKADLGYDEVPLADQPDFMLYKGKGCKDCVEGYKGRIGIYEVFAMSDDMERLLSQKATSLQVQQQAEKDGMVTMKQDGYLKALSGLTTTSEVARVAADS